MLSQYHQQVMLDRLHSDVGRFVPQPRMPQVVQPQPEQEPQSVAIAGGNRNLSPPSRTKQDDQAYKKATNKAQKEHDRRVQEKNKIRKQRYEKTIKDNNVSNPKKQK